MRIFLFNNSFLEINSMQKQKHEIFFINKLKKEESVFIYGKYKNLFSLKKKLQKFYISETRGFICLLELFGLGFSVTAKQNIIRFNVGFNHSIFYVVPQGVIVKTKRKSIFIFSYSFFCLRKTVIDLKNFRKLSVYKLKGIKEKDDLYHKKN